MAQTRKSARSRGKSDPDRCAGGGAGRCCVKPTYLGHPRRDVAELKLLTDREMSAAQRTSYTGTAVHELDPERAPAARSLDAATSRPCGLWLDTQPGIGRRIQRAERLTSSGSPAR